MHLDTTLKSLLAAGFALSVTLPVFAAETMDDDPPTDHAGYTQNVSPEIRKSGDARRDDWKVHRPEQRAEKRHAMREHWEKMTPDEHRDIRDAMKEHGQNISSDEREVQRKEMRQHWQNMSLEEREKFKNIMNGTDAISPLSDHTEGLPEKTVPK